MPMYPRACLTSQAHSELYLCIRRLGVYTHTQEQTHAHRLDQKATESHEACEQCMEELTDLYLLTFTRMLARAMGSWGGGGGTAGRWHSIENTEDERRGEREDKVGKRIEEV